MTTILFEKLKVRETQKVRAGASQVPSPVMGAENDPIPDDSTAFTMNINGCVSGPLIKPYSCCRVP